MFVWERIFAFSHNSSPKKASRLFGEDNSRFQMVDLQKRANKKIFMFEYRLTIAFLLDRSKKFGKSCITKFLPTAKNILIYRFLN